MSLLIDIAIAAESIVNAAWARAAANRERLRLRQDLQTVREQTDQRLRRQPGWEDAFTNPLITNYRPEEPVAVPGPEARAEGQVTIGRFYTDSTNPEIQYIWSGNGQVRVSNENTFDQFILPAGGDRAILGVAEGDGSNLACFYVDNNSVRQIAVPSSLSLQDVQPYSISFGWASRQVEALESIDEIFTPSFFFAFPQLFPSLHPPPPVNLEAYSIMRPIVETVAPDLKEIVIVTNDDVNPYINNGEFISVVSTTGYEWNAPDPADDEFLNLPLTDPRWRRIKVNGPPRSSVPIIPGVPTDQSDIGPQTYYVWDWNKPDFCREQLLALGFSFNDLEP